MTHDLYFVNGAKGGVGKSFIALSFIDYLLQKQDPNVLIVLIETDITNPDVYKTYKNEIVAQMNIDPAPVILQPLQTNDDLITILDKLDELVKTSQKKIIAVVNCSAGKSDGILSYLRKLQELSDNELPFNFHHFWVMNNQVDSLLLLQEHFEYIYNLGSVTIFLNEFFGTLDTFSTFYTSRFWNKLQGEMPEIRAFGFPKLSAKVASLIYTKRLPIQTILEQGTFGTRLELSRWRGTMRATFDEALQYV